jgi:hypothetical protein
MQISDSQFNAFYSLKTLSSIIPPVIMTVVSSKVLTIKSIVYSLCFACTIGQALFAIGIQNNDYALCLLGRFFIGTSDALTIMQQTIMCLWFPTSQLPMVFGLMLFLVKVVRTTNDNTASVLYNTVGLSVFFWIGFVICLFSVFCSFLLIQIHESVQDDHQASN